MEWTQREIGVAIGDILLGKYRVERVLGAGGMGAVVAARHLRLDQPVAIKVLLPGVVEDGEIVARFEREARASARMKSDHIARVTDVGTLESGAPYMVMEYLEGEDLDVLLRRTRSLPVDQAVELVVQTCEVLSEAHELGIVHRDLKPANLFCVKRPGGRLSIKVLDFGISKMMSEDLTTARAIMGSPAYMSPEQIRSAHSVDARADIWAIGVVLYELLTGILPFTGRTLPGMLTNIAMEPTPSVRHLRLDVPIGLDAVIQKCLKKDPADRYPSASELARALAPFTRIETRACAPAVSDGSEAVPMALPPSSRSSVPTVPTSWWRTVRGGHPEHGLGWVSAVAATLIALASLLGTLPRTPPGDSSARPHVAAASQVAFPTQLPGPSALPSCRDH